VEYVHSSKARPPLPPGPFLVVGLARSGISVARALQSRGERVSGVDSGHPAGLGDPDLAGISHTLETDGVAALDGVSTVVKSPGVPGDAVVVAEARRRGIPVLGELEIGWRLVPGTFVAITGTNGKTTTTELAAHLFRTAGRPVEVVGNVGNPLSSLAGRPLPVGTTVVCECSSFQLEDIDLFSPEVAVHLNLSPDHLDRHGDMTSYARAKQRIFMNQVDGDLAILNHGDRSLASLTPPGRASVVRFVAGDRTDGQPDLWVEDGGVVVDGRPLLPLADIPLLGSHNVANSMAAAAAALGLGLPAEVVAEGIRTFRGVTHRLEPVGTIGGVNFVNDSKATNVDATVTALRAFDQGVRIILGGSLKGEAFDDLAPAVASSCVAAYLIGDSAGEVESALAPAVAGGVGVTRCGDLETAVSAAFEDASPGETILLSPACASFDQFRDFEDRGDRFRRFVGVIDAR
jgi:UDP-N-acetylmuramoylalanine--D-glutamate ligase